MKKIEINFRGYKWDDYDFPETSGIYGIYSTSKNQQGEYIVGELLYIGLSNNLYRRINEHANGDYPRKKKYCYIYCELTEEQAKLAEAAIVSECKPKGNIIYSGSYPKDFDPVQLHIHGNHKAIPQNIEN